MTPSLTAGRQHNDSSSQSPTSPLNAHSAATDPPVPMKDEASAAAPRVASQPLSGHSASPSPSGSSLSQRELELQRKRARDRKSQQAMRDRTKWTIHTLSEQVAVLSAALDQRARDMATLEGKVGYLETENAQLRTQNAALQLSLMGRRNSTGDGGGHDGAAASAAVATVSPGSVHSLPSPLWELYPKNTPPSCLADQILQGFVDTIRASGTGSGSAAGTVVPSSPRERARRFSLRPNLCSLLDRQRRSDDDISNVVADVLHTYREIEELPKQVAVFYIIATLLKWMVLLDKQSWDFMPEWLRPVPSQLSTPHSLWIDRIPWPRAREYLIAHPEITLDDFAIPYSVGFKLNWPYDPASVLLPSSFNSNGTAEIAINPVYEEHMRQLRHWTVGDAFRQRFPELTRLIDLDSGQVTHQTVVPSPHTLGKSPQQSVRSASHSHYSPA